MSRWLLAALMPLLVVAVALLHGCGVSALLQQSPYWLAWPEPAGTLMALQTDMLLAALGPGLVAGVAVVLVLRVSQRWAALLLLPLLLVAALVACQAVMGVAAQSFGTTWQASDIWWELVIGFWPQLLAPLLAAMLILLWVAWLAQRRSRRRPHV